MTPRRPSLLSPRRPHGLTPDHTLGLTLGPTAGLTLVELLLASTLGAVLLMAAAQSTGMYAENLQVLTSEQGREVDAAITAVARDLRYGWWAEVTDSSTLLIAGPDGAEVSYSLDGGELHITRQDGSQDVLVSGLRAGSFTPSLRTRLREATPTSTRAVYWSMGAAPVSPSVLALDGQQRLAISFMVDSIAPVTGDVPGVDEQLLGASLGSWSLPAATAFNGGGQLVIELYRARAPGDARPQGSALARTVLPLSALPAASLLPEVVEPLVRGVVPAVITPTVADLLDRLVPPSRNTALDLSGLAAVADPGRAYVLVLGVEGVGLVAVKAHALASTAGTGCALSATLADAFSSAALTVPCSLSGEITHTRTTITSVLDGVTIALTDGTGVTSQGSFPLEGQALVSAPWLGVVPGELPSLQGGR